MPHALRGRAHVDAWFSGRDLDEVIAMATWIKAAISDPLAVASGAFQQAHTGRRMYWAHVPNTSAIVTYVALDYPVRVMTIISIVQAPDIYSMDWSG